MAKSHLHDEIRGDGCRADVEIGRVFRYQRADAAVGQHAIVHQAGDTCVSGTKNYYDSWMFRIDVGGIWVCKQGSCQKG